MPLPLALERRGCLSWCAFPCYLCCILRGREGHKKDAKEADEEEEEAALLSPGGGGKEKGAEEGSGAPTEQLTGERKEGRKKSRQAAEKTAQKSQKWGELA